ncbi:MAG: deoxyribose-phosphate aldolase [Anaerolineae bacterium]|nr:deoxyribose-phosphate aldolase [Anaerolineae bacterium]
MSHSLSAAELARLIDSTLLKPEVTHDQIVALCQEARAHRFASVAVNPCWTALAAQLLSGAEGVVVCTVAGFPLGATTPEVKAFEAEQALLNGAHDIDMVMNVGALKSGDFDLVGRDIAAVVAAVRAHGGICKVILETGLLTDDEKIAACRIAQEAGADFVKTSTGFGPGGATVHDIALMRRTVGPEMGVKASGGVRSYADALALVEAGATRIGTSSGARLVAEAQGSVTQPGDAADY